MTQADGSIPAPDGLDEARGVFRTAVDDLAATLARLDDTHLQAVHDLAVAVTRSWTRGGKLLVCGNGGSAADAQHIAAELVGRFLAERPGYPALALTVNTSTLTAVGNDYGYDAVFARQVQALGGADDVLLVISTSGNSGNCIEAVSAARDHGMAVHGFLGGDGGRLAGLVDGALVVPSGSTPHIQEVHITLGHVLCQLLEMRAGRGRVMAHAGAFVENLRPRQWTKNLLLFAGIIFAQKLGETDCLLRVLAGTAVFCLTSGVIYVFNDIADRELDRRHPTKRKRPIASGRLPVAAAVRLGLGLLVFCLMCAGLLGPAFLGAVALFLLWNWLYTRWLKRVPVLDVTGIGMSFVIRATAGVFVMLPSCPGVEISIWLLLCTFFLSLFLGFCKRRDELLKIAQASGETRPVLRGYSEPMLNALIGGSFALTSMMYALYTVWPETVAHFGTRDLIFTLPFVLLGMGRYLYLVFLEDKGGRPHEILLLDIPLQVVVIAWIVTAIRIIGI